MKNRIIFIISIILTLMFAVFTGSEFLYFVFILLGFLLLFSYMSIKRSNIKMYDYFRINLQKATVGDTLKLRYKVLYNAISPIPYAEVKCKISKKLGGMDETPQVVFISPFSTIFINKEFKCKSRGYYKMGEVHVHVKDIFNMFTKEIVFNKKIDLTVYPRFYNIENMKLPATEFFGNISVKDNMYEDYTSISSIRDYKEGDNVKMIDWKSSAKHNDIKIKKNELSANTKVYILIDGFKGNFLFDENNDSEELMVETTASIINYCLKKKVYTTLITNTLKRENISGRDLGRFNVFLKELIRFSINGSIKFDEFLQIESRKITYSSTLILLTTNLDEKLFSKLISLKNKKFYLILVLIKKGENKISDKEDEKIDYIKNLGIDTYVISSSEEILDVMGGGK